MSEPRVTPLTHGDAFYDCRMIVEPSHADARWCIDIGDEESLVPAWLVPFWMLRCWRRIKKRRATQAKLAALAEGKS